MTVSIRLAEKRDVPEVRQLIEKSVWGLQGGDYSAAQLERALKGVYGVDTQLIADGIYYVAEARDVENKALVGCGGWSWRKTLYGGDQWVKREDALLDPARDAAKIRAFFVHPSWARRGIGGTILEACEAAARAYGFHRLEMGATLPGVPFYRAQGYVEVEQAEVPLGDGVTLPILKMAKDMGWRGTSDSVE